MTEYSKGDYTNCRYDICEILRDDEVYCIVGTEYADKIIKVLEENEQLKESKKELQFQLNICADHRNEFHRVARENGNCVGKLEKENEQLKQENQELHKLNQEYVDSLSDEKKETLSEMLNAILGDDGE